MCCGLFMLPGTTQRSQNWNQCTWLYTRRDYHYERIKSSHLLTIIDQSINSKNSQTTVQSSHKLMQFAQFSAFLSHQCSIIALMWALGDFLSLHKQEAVHNSPIVWSSSCSNHSIVPDKSTTMGSFLECIYVQVKWLLQASGKFWVLLLFLHTNQAYSSQGIFIITYIIIHTNQITCFKNKFNILQIF